MKKMCSRDFPLGTRFPPDHFRTDHQITECDLIFRHPGAIRESKHVRFTVDPPKFMVESVYLYTRRKK